MIRFDLRCSKDHGFEAWFRDNASFEALSAEGALECPVCGNRDVEKAIMAPRISKSMGKPAMAGKADPPKASAPQPFGPVERDPDMPKAEAEGRDTPVAVAGAAEAAMEQAKALRSALEDLRTQVEASCDYVGKAFPEEARKIHYGEAEPRGIYGESSEEEAKALSDEGVAFARLPLPRRHDA